MLNKILLLLAAVVTMATAIKECNRTHPAFDDNSCRRLRTPENRLYKFLLKDYNRDIRPVQVNNAVTKVVVGLVLQNIDLDTNTQKLKANAWLHLNWLDEFLRWNYDDFNRQNEIMLPSEAVWTPDISLYNGNNIQKNHHVLVKYNGDVTWVNPSDLEVRCESNARFFPYDQHTCNIILGSWVQNAYQVNVEPQEFDTQMAFSNHWKIVSTNVSREAVKYDCCPEPYARVTFSIKLARNCFNYTALVILPLIILSVFSLLIFLFPLHSNARIGFALLILAGFFALFIYIQTSVANLSPNLPLISIYIFVMIILLTVAIVVLIVLANCSSFTGKLPDFVRNTLCRSCLDSASNNENEWRKLASCLDKFFFYLFLIVIVLFIIVFIILFLAL